MHPVVHLDGQAIEEVDGNSWVFKWNTGGKYQDKRDGYIRKWI